VYEVEEQKILKEERKNIEEQKTQKIWNLKLIQELIIKTCKGVGSKLFTININLL